MVESHGAVSAWPTHIIVKHAFSIDKLKVRTHAQTAVMAAFVNVACGAIVTRTRRDKCARQTHVAVGEGVPVAQQWCLDFAT
jgi:hypothetical protein